MLKYINILLDDASVSFCHYEVKKKATPISADILNQGIRFAMKDNLNIQFVYPRHELPDFVDKAVFQIDHVKIGKQDVIVYDSWPEAFAADKVCVIRTKKDELFSVSLPSALPIRLNIVITDICSFNENDFDRYKAWLEREVTRLKHCFHNINLMDRLSLKRMNNCNAGWETITLAPNGKFYICPAFYQNDLQSIGDLEHGLNIPNEQLYRLEHAPICSRCDAFQCKRCIWLNLNSTFEVNIPSHEQCVVAHLERNAAKLIDSEKIPAIDYLDPFEIISR